MSVKSNLNRNEIIDALAGIASIPPTKSLEGRVNILLKIKNYDDWPLKVVYATNGIAAQTLLEHINDYYTNNTTIPVTRRPDFIHVAGQYLIVRATEGMSLHHKVTGDVTTLTEGQYYKVTSDADLQSIVWTLNQLQKYASVSTHIHFSYDEIINKIAE